MKWFKHLSGSLNNSIISEAIERFGGDGYMVFFGILEMVSDEFDIYNPGRLTLRMKKITKNLQLSRQKTVKILRFFDEKAKTNTSKDVSFLASIDKNHVTINCKRLANLCDNHTQKLLKDTLKSLRSKDEVTSLQEVEVRSKNKKEIKEISAKEPFYLTYKKRKLTGKRLESFGLFWYAFGYKKGKASAADSWLDIPELTNDLVTKICLAAENTSKERSQTIESGNTPKMAQGWLAEKRWEDEAYIKTEKKRIYDK